MAINQGPSFLGIKLLDHSTSATVAAAATEDTTIQAPKGQCYRINRISFEIPDPAGSSSGSHTLYLLYNLTDRPQEGLIGAAGNFGTSITTSYGIMSASDESPSGNAEQNRVIMGLSRNWITSTIPLYWRYVNGTDVSQTGSRLLKLLVEVYKEVL